jgi:hypothetical protein
MTRNPPFGFCSHISNLLPTALIFEFTPTYVCFGVIPIMFFYVLYCSTGTTEDYGHRPVYGMGLLVHKIVVPSRISTW